MHLFVSKKVPMERVFRRSNCMSGKGTTQEMLASILLGRSSVLQSGEGVKGVKHVEIRGRKWPKIMNGLKRLKQEFIL